MKIQSSSVMMSSTHQESSYAYKESMTIQASKSANAAGAILSISSEGAGKSAKDSMEEYQKQQEKQEKEKRQMNDIRTLERIAKSLRNRKIGGIAPCQGKDIQIETLRRILAALRGEKMKEAEKNPNVAVLDLRSLSFEAQEVSSFDMFTGSSNTEMFSESGFGKAGTSVTSQEASFSGSSSKMVSASETTLSMDSVIGTSAGGTVWQKIKATSGYYAETESTTFASNGIVTTADGRNISFNVEMSMSRGMMSKFNSLNVTEYILTDPLIINIDTNRTTVSNQKFYFDIDSDGKDDQISFAGKGSGFLALDKNGDGVINNGSELFGTKSGDGFKDLAAYDEDHNGWIDENDDVFSKLLVWSKDDDGKDHLIDLKSADVGAIYLGNADTQYSLKNSANELNAEIKKTGIYLKESTGAVGTIAHVDIAL